MARTQGHFLDMGAKQENELIVMIHHLTISYVLSILWEKHAIIGYAMKLERYGQYMYVYRWVVLIEDLSQTITLLSTE